MPNLNTIVGKFGGGKSSTAVSMMLEHMAKGGVVASNINLRSDPFISEIFKTAQCGFVHALRTLYAWEYKEGQFIYIPDTELIPIASSKQKLRYIPKAARFWEHVPRGKPDLHVLVFIDEAHKVWPKNAYEYMPSGDTDTVSVLRHLHIELYWMTQHQEHVWIDLRRLTEDWIYVNNLKKGGLGIVGRLPFWLRPVVQLFSTILGLIISPILGCFPDFIRIRRFRMEEEIPANLYPGYPKIVKYSPFVLQSYDSPHAVEDVPTNDEVPNDFREKKTVPVKDSLLKRLRPALGGAVLLTIFLGWGCSRFHKSESSVSSPAKPSVLVSPPPPPVVPPPPDVVSVSFLNYDWYAVVNGVARISIQGVIYMTGDVLPFADRRFLRIVSQYGSHRVFFDDGSSLPLVKGSSERASVPVTSAFQKVGSVFRF